MLLSLLCVYCLLWQQHRLLKHQIKQCSGAAVASPALELNPCLPVTAAVARHGSGGAAWQGPDLVCRCLGAGVLQQVEQKNPSLGHVTRDC